MPDAPTPRSTDPARPALPSSQSPSPSAGPPGSQAQPAQQQSTGRGLALITLAKIWFMVGGGAIGFLLPHMFPRESSTARYGQWGFILTVMSPVNNVMVTATIQAVSKFASRGAQWVEGAKRAALRMQVGVALVVGGAFYFLAPLIADAEKDPGMAAALRLSTGVVVCYAFYAVFVGAANGARQFQKQAMLDVLFTTLRAGAVLLGALLLHTVIAAVAGFVAAAATILLSAVVVVGLRPAEQRVDRREILRFMTNVALYLLLLNLLMFVDYLVLKRLIAQAAEQAGATAAIAADTANRSLGVYNGALQIARLPYQAILSVTFVIFPLVSQSTFASDGDRTRGYISKSLRLSMIVVTALAVAVAAHPTALLSIFPKNAAGQREYLVAAPALSCLMFDYVAFSLLSIAGTIMNGAGQTRSTTAIGLATLVLDVVLNVAAVSFALAHGRDPLVYAAGASTISIGAGLVVSLGFLQRRFGASLPLSSVARTAVAAIVAVLVGRFVPIEGIAGVLACAIAGLVYLVMLFATGELTIGELRALAGRRR